jgi:hypothetical protein
MYNDTEEMYEKYKEEHYEGKIMENQYNCLCTWYYLYRTTLFTRDLSPHKNALSRKPPFSSRDCRKY